MKTIPAYIQEFAAATGAHPRFIEALGRGIEANFLALTGHKWPAGALILPHDPAAGFVVQTNQMLSWVKADLLLGTDAITTLIVWGPVEGAEPVSPSQEVEDLVVRLDHLPVDDVLEILDQKADQPFPAEAFGFRVQYDVKILPHVRMQIMGEPGKEEVLSESLGTARNRWNAHDEGLIHSISKVIENSPGQYSLMIDLGSAAEDGLEALLEALDESSVSVEKVTLSSEPSRHL